MHIGQSAKMNPSSHGTQRMVKLDPSTLQGSHTSWQVFSVVQKLQDDQPCLSGLSVSLTFPTRFKVAQPTSSMQAPLHPEPGVRVLNHAQIFEPGDCY